MNDAPTIVALSTPTGEGAIGVIRLSGKEALSIASSCLAVDLLDKPANTAFLTNFLVDNQILDQVVLTPFHAPNSYTGEHVIELSFHGSSYILSSAIDALISTGAQLAKPGEFTQRAYLNGKLDLSQAEAVADLINAESEAEHRLAMKQMKGDFSAEIAALRQKLIDFASLIELELDFAEEDVEFANRDELVKLINDVIRIINDLIGSFKYGNVVKTGVPVAIVGEPNVGKSTLLNLLLKEDRAIVSDIAGTTRDSIEDVMVLAGTKFRFIDTAGLRQTDDTIERIGVERSFEKIKQASIVLYLFEGEKSEQYVTTHLKSITEHIDLNQQAVIGVANKSDLKPYPNSTIGDNDIPVQNISALTGAGVNQLISQLTDSGIQKASGAQQTIVTNARHVDALKQTKAALEQALNGINNTISGDLIASDIREALHHLGSITGEISTDDLLGNIFGKFCIGK